MQQYVHPQMPTVVYTPEQVPLSEINASKIIPAISRLRIQDTECTLEDSVFSQKLIFKQETD